VKSVETRPWLIWATTTPGESAFHTMQGRGLSVLVRSEWRQTAAQLWLKPPDEVLDFLGLWLKAIAKVVTRVVARPQR